MHSEAAKRRLVLESKRSRENSINEKDIISDRLNLKIEDKNKGL